MLIRCQNCGRESSLISQSLGICLDCIRQDFAAVLPNIKQAHSEARRLFSLPVHPPKSETGWRCQICVNECRLAPGSRSYCGLRFSQAGKIKGATADYANVSWYYDPLPTNCVADWVCPGGTGAGYPRFAYSDGPEYGYKNLAVFYQACSFDCLFCQNWHYRSLALQEGKVTAASLANAVDDRTSCICYFGGDPTPQLPHSLRVARLALQKKRGRILRICWETNGSTHPALLKQAAEIALDSGGCIKFDLKAWDEGLHIALCGISNKRTLENFQLLAEYAQKRPKPPLLVASTLLVPGYVDGQEVSNLARFISSLSPEIPYSLLAFAPQFMMRDLPTTSRRHAEECLAEAQAQGLKRVRLGNVHLLGKDY
ncbi:MAG: radical SAM protein [Chloroflexi bacterium]|nr:radical SAM protein [Chloroflexota bacterium]